MTTRTQLCGKISSTKEEQRRPGLCFYILVVEDDASISNLIRTTLQERAISAPVRWTEKRGADPIDSGHWDLILLDLMLPEISGYDPLDISAPRRRWFIIISAMGQA